LRSVQIDLIEEIENVGTKLQGNTLPQRDALGDGDVALEEAGTAQGIPPSPSKSANRSSQIERLPLRVHHYCAIYYLGLGAYLGKYIEAPSSQSLSCGRFPPFIRLYKRESFCPRRPHGVSTTQVSRFSR